MITITLYGDPEAFRITPTQQQRILYALGAGLEELLHDLIPVPLGCTVKRLIRLDRCSSYGGNSPPGEICASITGGFNWGFILADVTIDCEVAESIAREQGGCSKRDCECGKYTGWTHSQATVDKVLLAVKCFLCDQGPWEVRAVAGGGVTSYEEESSSRAQEASARLR